MNKKISYETISVHKDDIKKLGIDWLRTRQIILSDKNNLKFIIPEFCITNLILDNLYWKNDLVIRNHNNYRIIQFVKTNSNKYDNFKRIIDTTILDE